jgi:menaquinone-dependent protoporphyrinogen oxidase
MKALIVYATRKGATEEVARRIAAQLEDKKIEADVVNVKTWPSLDGYDCVIIGASIRAGSVPGIVKRFCLEKEEELLGKKLCLYVSCLTRGEKGVAYIDANFPPRLVAHSAKSLPAGGRVELEKLGWVPRTMLKMAANLTENRETFDGEAITALADAAAE